MTKQALLDRESRACLVAYSLKEVMKLNKLFDVLFAALVAAHVSTVGIYVTSVSQGRVSISLPVASALVMQYNAILLLSCAQNKKIKDTP